MKKTMSAIFAAIAVLSANFCPMSASAVFPSDSASSYYEMTEGYTRVEELNIFDWLAEQNTLYPQSYFSKVLVNDNGTEFICLKPYRSVSVFTIADEISPDDISNAIGEIYVGEYGDYLLGGSWVEEEGDSKLYVQLTPQKTNEICNHLKEKGMITDCCIAIDIYSVFRMYGRGINYYDKQYYDYNFYGDGVICNPDKRDKGALLKDYVSTKLEGYTLEEATVDEHEYYVLVPPEGTDLTEQIQTAQKIYEATGVCSSYTSPAIAPPIVEVPMQDRFIEVYDAVKGDANCDGKATIADSVAILQHISNRDKYGLKTQGLINADVDGEAGVTANDARVLQEWDADK